MSFVQCLADDETSHYVEKAVKRLVQPRQQVFYISDHRPGADGNLTSNRLDCGSFFELVRHATKNTIGFSTHMHDRWRPRLSFENKSVLHGVISGPQGLAIHMRSTSPDLVICNRELDPRSLEVIKSCVVIDAIYEEHNEDWWYEY